MLMQIVKPVRNELSMRIMAELISLGLYSDFMRKAREVDDRALTPIVFGGVVSIERLKRRGETFQSFYREYVQECRKRNLSVVA